MNRQQKIAWYSISVLSAVFLLTFAVTYWVVAKCGWQKSVPGLCTIGLSCIAGIGPLIFRKDKRQTVHSDERDYLLELHASFAGFGASYCFFVIAGMAILLSHGFSGTISVTWLIPLLVGSYFTAEFVRSIAILIQYGWARKTS
ncbi:MAG: hypothetical protein ACYSSO_13550 [Planctomycetota bacterium]|jgi:hypothetical protein